MIIATTQQLHDNHPQHFYKCIAIPQQPFSNYFMTTRTKYSTNFITHSLNTLAVASSPTRTAQQLNTVHSFKCIATPQQPFFNDLTTTRTIYSRNYIAPSLYMLSIASLQTRTPQQRNTLYSWKCIATPQQPLRSSHSYLITFLTLFTTSNNKV